MCITLITFGKVYVMNYSKFLMGHLELEGLAFHGAPQEPSKEKQYSVLTRSLINLLQHSGNFLPHLGEP